MVQSPEQYRWSSYPWHAWSEPDPLVNDHDLYVGLGARAHDRQCAYRYLFRSQIRRSTFMTSANVSPTITP